MGRPRSTFPYRKALDGSRRNLVLLAAVATWAALVTHQLHGQVIVYDEWHTLGAAIGLDFGEIFFSLGEHSSVPVALYLKAALESVGLGEGTLRGPFLLGGLATLIAASLIARRVAGRPTGDALAWLLALSPFLLYHARFARQYALATPCALLALAFAYRWDRRARTRDAGAYALWTAAAGFLTPAHLAFLLSPLMFFAVDWLLGAERRTAARLAAIATLGAATLLLLALLLGPAFVHDAQALQAKIMAPPRSVRWAGVVRVASGLVSARAGAAFLGLSAIGVWKLWRRDRRLCLYLLLAVSAQVLSIFVLQPRVYGQAQVFVRYLMPATVVVYFLMAWGLSTLIRSLVFAVGAAPSRGRVWIAEYGAVLFLVGLVPFGPLHRLFVWPDAWANEHMISALVAPHRDPGRLVKRLPEFYEELSRRPAGSITIIEAPYTAFGVFAPYGSYQLRHRQRVWVASEADACEFENARPLHRHPGMALHNVFYLADPAGLDASGAQFLVIHRNPPTEHRNYKRNSWTGRNLRMLGEGCVDYARSLWGAPVFEDRDLAVFALKGAAASDVNRRK